MSELYKRSKNELSMKLFFSVRKIVHDQKVKLERYQRSYEITTDEEGQARDRNNYDCGCFIQNQNMVRRD